MSLHSQLDLWIPHLLCSRKEVLYVEGEEVPDDEGISVKLRSTQTVHDRQTGKCGLVAMATEDCWVSPL